LPYEVKGDVFGCPIEGWRENQIKETYKEYKTLPSG
jgi:ADP-ribosyl-[dinitrogen reductase] hydrolase